MLLNDNCIPKGKNKSDDEKHNDDDDEDENDDGNRKGRFGRTPPATPGASIHVSTCDGQCVLRNQDNDAYDTTDGIPR